MKDPAVVPTSKRWTRSPLPRPRPEQRFPATRAWRSPQPATVIHLRGGDSIVRSQVRACTTPAVVRTLLSSTQEPATISKSKMGRRGLDPRVACNISSRSYARQRDRFGEPVIEHVARVSAAVPPWARAVARLHDLLELAPMTAAELCAQGLTAGEYHTLELLTRLERQPYAAHVRRIADAPGDPGRIARAVKIADLDDHLAHRWLPPEAPPYAWARRYLSRLSVERSLHLNWERASIAQDHVG